MNPKYDSIKNQDFSTELDLNAAGSLDDFLKELEAKERDLDMSPEFVVEIEEYDFAQANELAELEKLLETYAPNKDLDAPIPTNFAAKSSVPNFTNPLIPNSRTFSDLEAEIAKLNSEITKMSVERRELGETMNRRSTDYENFKNRTERERAEIFRSVLSNLAIKILPVIDNIGRALNSATNHGEMNSPDFQQFIDGIGLINHQLSEVLIEMGIQPIMAVGEPFNPHFHEAVATVPTSQVPHNTVVQELVCGYRIDDKVIRPAMVKVSSSANSASSDVSLELE